MTNQSYFQIMDDNGRLLVRDVDDHRRIDFYRALAKELVYSHTPSISVRLVVVPVTHYEVFNVEDKI